MGLAPRYSFYWPYDLDTWSLKFLINKLRSVPSALWGLKERIKEKGLQHTRHKIKCGSPCSKLSGESHTVTPDKPRLKDAATKNSSTAPFLDIWLQTGLPLCSLNVSVSQRRQEVSLATDLNTCKSCQWWPFLLLSVVVPVTTVSVRVGFCGSLHSCARIHLLLSSHC